MHAYILVDLGFGDAGKGLLTDFLARHSGAGLVVRYNGGAQAGHNVVTPDGRHHTFAQFGSGSFVPGVRTYLSHHVVVHPAALLAEGDLLKSKGVGDVYSRLRLSDQALIITPFHQAANRIREMVRGEHRHGSCGVGVGEAVEHAQSYPEDRVVAGDLIRPDALRRKLRCIQEQEREQMAALRMKTPFDSQIALEFSTFEREDIIEAWIASIARIGELGLVASDDVLERWLHETETVIFEGAQGVLLDAEAGFHPFTTWSRCTAGNALDLISEMAPGSQTVRIGVMRSYAVRHGPGPLPSETDELASVISEHNRYGKWQGAVRYGWFDALLARYALEVAGGVDAFALTHLDVPPQLETWKVCPAYRGADTFRGCSADFETSDGLLTRFRVEHYLSFEQRARLTHLLFNVEPILETCSTDEKRVVQKIESLIHQPVDIVSNGPCAKDVKFLNPLPM